jgi:hypothetical protein
MDVSMLWKDLLGGFLIAGVPRCVRPRGRVEGRSSWHGARVRRQLIGDAIAGPLIAIVTFVCSIGNVPMAAILWAERHLVRRRARVFVRRSDRAAAARRLPQVLRLRMALYIFAVFFATMVLSAIAMDGAFSALHLVPQPNPNIRHDLTLFSFNYTFWLNLDLRRPRDLLVAARCRAPDGPSRAPRSRPPGSTGTGTRGLTPASCRTAAGRSRCRGHTLPSSS